MPPWALAVALVALGAAGAAEPGTSAIALFDFASREPDELSVRRGEVLRVLQTNAPGDEGWALARAADGRRSSVCEREEATREAESVRVAAAERSGSLWDRRMALCLRRLREAGSVKRPRGIVFSCQVAPRSREKDVYSY